MTSSVVMNSIARYLAQRHKISISIKELSSLKIWSSKWLSPRFFPKKIWLSPGQIDYVRQQFMNFRSQPRAPTHLSRRKKGKFSRTDGNARASKHLSSWFYRRPYQLAARPDIMSNRKKVFFIHGEVKEFCTLMGDEAPQLTRSNAKKVLWKWMCTLQEQKKVPQTKFQMSNYSLRAMKNLSESATGHTIFCSTLVARDELMDAVSKELPNNLQAFAPKRPDQNNGIGIDRVDVDVSTSEILDTLREEFKNIGIPHHPVEYDRWHSKHNKDTPTLAGAIYFQSEEEVANVWPLLKDLAIQIAYSEASFFKLRKRNDSIRGAKNPEMSAENPILEKILCSTETNGSKLSSVLEEMKVIRAIAEEAKEIAQAAAEQADENKAQIEKIQAETLALRADAARTQEELNGKAEKKEVDEASKRLKALEDRIDVLLVAQRKLQESTAVLHAHAEEEANGRRGRPNRKSKKCENLKMLNGNSEDFDNVRNKSKWRTSDAPGWEAQVLMYQGNVRLRATQSGAVLLQLLHLGLSSFVLLLHWSFVTASWIFFNASCFWTLCYAVPHKAIFLLSCCAVARATYVGPASLYWGQPQVTGIKFFRDFNYLSLDEDFYCTLLAIVSTIVILGRYIRQQSDHDIDSNSNGSDSGRPPPTSFPLSDPSTPGDIKVAGSPVHASPAPAVNPVDIKALDDSLEVASLSRVSHKKNIMFLNVSKSLNKNLGIFIDILTDSAGADILCIAEPGPLTPTSLHALSSIGIQVFGKLRDRSAVILVKNSVKILYHKSSSDERYSFLVLDDFDDQGHRIGILSGYNPTALDQSSKSGYRRRTAIACCFIQSCSQRVGTLISAMDENASVIPRSTFRTSSSRPDVSCKRYTSEGLFNRDMNDLGMIRISPETFTCFRPGARRFTLSSLDHIRSTNPSQVLHVSILVNESQLNYIDKYQPEFIEHYQLSHWMPRDSLDHAALWITFRINVSPSCPSPDSNQKSLSISKFSKLTKLFVLKSLNNSVHGLAPSRTNLVKLMSSTVSNLKDQQAVRRKRPHVPDPVIFSTIMRILDDALSSNSPVMVPSRHKFNAVRFVRRVLGNSGLPTLATSVQINSFKSSLRRGYEDFHKKHPDDWGTSSKISYDKDSFIKFMSRSDEKRDVKQVDIVDCKSGQILCTRYDKKDIAAEYHADFNKIYGDAFPHLSSNPWSRFPDLDVKHNSALHLSFASVIRDTLEEPAIPLEDLSFLSNPYSPQEVLRAVKQLNCKVRSLPKFEDFQKIIFIISSVATHEDPIISFMAETLSTIRLAPRFHPHECIEYGKILVKKLKNARTTDNVRVTSSLNLFRKLIERMDVNRQLVIWKRRGYLHSSQIGCTEGSACYHNVLAIDSIFSIAQKEDRDALLCFVDQWKCFPSIDWEFCQTAKRLQGIPRSFSSFIVNSLANSTVHISTNTEHITSIQRCRGCPEGAISSSFDMVSIANFFHRAFEKLRMVFPHDVGFCIPSANVSSLGVVDDVCLVASSVKGMNIMLSFLRFLHTTAKATEKPSKRQFVLRFKSPPVSVIIQGQRIDRKDFNVPANYLGAAIAFGEDGLKARRKVIHNIMNQAYHDARVLALNTKQAIWRYSSVIVGKLNYFGAFTPIDDTDDHKLQVKHRQCSRLPRFSLKSMKDSMVPLVTVTDSPTSVIISASLIAVVDMLTREDFRGTFARYEWNLPGNDFPSLKSYAHGWLILDVDVVDVTTLSPDTSSLEYEIRDADVVATDGSGANEVPSFAITTADQSSYNRALQSASDNFLINWDHADRSNILPTIFSLSGSFDSDVASPSVQSAEAWPLAILALNNFDGVVHTDSKTAIHGCTKFAALPNRQKLRTPNRQCFRIISNQNPQFTLLKIRSHADGLDYHQFLHSMADHVADSASSDACDVCVSSQVLAAGEYFFAPRIDGKLITDDVVKAVKKHAFTKYLRKAQHTKRKFSLLSSRAFYVFSPEWIPSIKLALKIFRPFQFQVYIAVASNTINTNVVASVTDRHHDIKCSCGHDDEVIHWIVSCPHLSCYRTVWVNLMCARLVDALVRDLPAHEKRSRRHALNGLIPDLIMAFDSAPHKDRFLLLMSVQSPVVQAWSQILRCSVSFAIRAMILETGPCLVSLHNRCAHFRGAPYSASVRKPSCE